MSSVRILRFFTSYPPSPSSTNGLVPPLSLNIPTCSNFTARSRIRLHLVPPGDHRPSSRTAFADAAPSASAMASQEPVNVPRPRTSVTFGLIVLAFIFPWLALWLDGASWPTIGCNFVAWMFFPIFGTFGAIVHAIICLCRSNEHRKYSKPARRRLRYNNNYSADTKAQEEKKTAGPKLEKDPTPAPVTRAVAEQPIAKPSASSSSTSVTEPSPGPVESVATEPPAAKSSTTSSTSSVSSSDVEGRNPPADDPPPRTATAKKEDDPFKDPIA